MNRARSFFFVCLGILALALAYHFGAQSAGAQSATGSPNEVAVLSGVIVDGGTIPLPTFADGTTAEESECSWTVSPNYGDSGCYASTLNCFTTGRVVTVRLSGNCGIQLGQRANYMIVAVRGVNVPTPSRSISIGRLKAKYAK